MAGVVVICGWCGCYLWLVWLFLLCGWLFVLGSLWFGVAFCGLVELPLIGFALFGADVVVTCFSWWLVCGWCNGLHAHGSNVWTLWLYW